MSSLADQIPAEAIQVTRQDLYDLVWSVPVSKACKQFGFSDVGLAKYCDE